MKITLTLSEVLNRCSNWNSFCSQQGISEWACNEGFGDSKITLSENEAKQYGLIQ